MTAPELLEQRPVAILFSGGDAPGMNPLLRDIARLGLNEYNVPVLGIMDGYEGLVRTVQQIESGEVSFENLCRRIARRSGVRGLHAKGQHIVLLDSESVSGIVVQGGIKLRTARSKEFLNPSRRAQVIKLLRDLNVRALIVAGGDGSLRGAEDVLKESDIQVIGIPCTIDNDLPVTDMAIGVQSAIDMIVRNVDSIKDTARSHRRVMVMETMGRDCGELTQLAAIASGAEYAFIPEDGYLTGDRIRKLAGEIEDSFARGRTHSIVLVAEGVQMDKNSWESPAWVFSAKLGEALRHGPCREVEIRATVLGHVQRGGRPAPYEAILSSEFADVAWNAISKGTGSGITVLQQGEHKLVPFGSPSSPHRAARLQRLHRQHQAVSRW